MKKITVNYDDDYNVLLDFVKETKLGKYSKEAPVIDCTYQRIKIQEQNETTITDEFGDNLYLYGIS